MAANQGTTPHLKEIFIGRCWKHQNDNNNQINYNINCTQLWTAFRNSFAFKDPCNVTGDDYNKFFTLLQVDSNKTLSNVSNVVSFK